MKRLFTALACASLAALAGLPARACTDPGGIGGTGITGDGGIGGTGQRASVEVGVVGVITGFASICVNGIEVHYDAATPVSMNGEPASADALAVGKVVAVRAVGSGAQARARSIDIVDSAVGSVTSVESAGTLVQVQGQRVRIDPSTVLGGNLTREQLAAAQIGEAMRVSGLRAADGTIVATRVEAAAPEARPVSADAADPGLGRFVVQGYVSEVQPKALRVGATTFNVTPELGSQLARDRLVRISGRMEGGTRIVERADILAGPFDIRPERTLRADPRSSRDSDDRRGRSGSDRDRGDRSGPGGGGRGPDRPERPERVDRSGPSDRPDRVDRSGRR
jgi:uncharacterized protein DUF5666